MNNKINENNVDSKILHDLMQDNNQELPPAQLDRSILQQARLSTSGNHKPNYKPWMAAASVVLVLPMVWFLSQNQELTHANNAIQPEPAATPESDFVGEATQMDAEYDSQVKEEEALAPRAMARPKPTTPQAVSDNLQKIIEEQGTLSITGQPSSSTSIDSSRELLMDELKAGKRTIKPSTMGPLMALEFEQFERYIDRGQFDLADQLLTEMQESFPDYDYEDMIYKLALAEANQTDNQ